MSPPFTLQIGAISHVLAYHFSCRCGADFVSNDDVDGSFCQQFSITHHLYRKFIDTRSHIIVNASFAENTRRCCLNAVSIQANPGKYALMICVELSSVHTTFDDNINDAILHAIFADGCAAAVLKGARKSECPKVSPATRRQSFTPTMVVLEYWWCSTISMYDVWYFADSFCVLPDIYTCCAIHFVIIVIIVQPQQSTNVNFVPHCELLNTSEVHGTEFFSFSCVDAASDPVANTPPLVHVFGVQSAGGNKSCVLKRRLCLSVKLSLRSCREPSLS